MLDSDDEGYFLFGTPLDPYEEDEVPKKKSAFQDITEQYALDANGKRRFHGAFTGGFSAGHYNSVAVPEGWTPQTFKSSRSSRMQLNQKPEDFMDDEDRSEFGIAPREIHTTNEFTSTKRPKPKRFYDGPIPGQPVLHDLLEPVHETAAIRILKNMGWRPGSGIGEKLTLKEKKAIKKKLYTCHIPEDLKPKEENDEIQSSEKESDDEYSEILFEPDDFEPFIAKPKVDSFGLGYSGLDRHSVLSAYQNPKNDNEWTGSHLVTNDKGRKVSIRGQAFGVGALEEEDEDIYAREDLSGYDFVLDSVTDENNKITQKLPKENRSVLEGFISALKIYKDIKIYPAPVLPTNYIPKYSNVKHTRFNDINNTSINVNLMNRDRGLGRHDLTAEDRNKILGENEKVKTQANQLSISAKLNSDTLKINSEKKENANKSYEEKIIAVVGRNVNFVSDSKNEKVDIPKNDSKNLGEFKPFASDPAKQLRYEKFILTKKSNEIQDINTEEDTLSQWEKNKELLEFEQAFKLYKPLTGVMSDRFIGAQNQDNSPLELVKGIVSLSYVTSEKQEAARLGKFGKLTREVNTWKPDSLLCKRFNIPEPFCEGSTALNTEKKKHTYSLFDYLENPIHNKTSYLKEQEKSLEMRNASIPKVELLQQKISPERNLLKTTISSSKPKRITVAELFLQEKENERQNNSDKNTSKDIISQEFIKSNEAEDEFVKETIDSFNKIDLYKAIFLSESESEDTEEPQNMLKLKTKTSANEPVKNVERNTSPPKGIFANLNFDKINSWRENRDISNIGNKQSNTNSDATDKISKNCEQSDIEVYGPKLPDKPTVNQCKSNTNIIEDDSSMDSSDWVERKQDKHKSSKSKHKKQKKKKSKSEKHSKHKHKSKSKHKE